MNISPADSSKAPYSASGEVLDRMEGTLSGGNGGAKKSLFDGPTKKSPAGSDLKKKSAKTTGSKDDKATKEEPEEVAATETSDPEKEGAKPGKKRRSRKKWKVSCRFSNS